MKYTIEINEKPDLFELIELIKLIVKVLNAQNKLEVEEKDIPSYIKKFFKQSI